MQVVECFSVFRDGTLTLFTTTQQQQQKFICEADSYNHLVYLWIVTKTEAYL